ncbi:MAG TPA: response regulator [Casimicrobiaceae bacterium]
MSSNVVQIPLGPRSRVLIAHEHGMVRHALRKLIEAEDVAVIEVADGEAALNELDHGRFDLLILQLDLPEQNGADVILMHRVLLAHQQSRVEPPDVILTLPPEVRDNKALTDHLRSFGVAEFIDDEPRREVAGLVEMILRARMARQQGSGKPAAA